MGTPLSRFERCFGPPRRVVRQRGQRCVLYDVRGDDTQWRFCLRHDSIASAAGNQLPADTGESELAGAPLVGLGCDEPNSIACDRLGVQVRLRHSAARVMVRLGSGQAQLSPDDGSGPGSRSYTGRVSHAGIVHGPLRIQPDRGRSYWAGGHPRDAIAAITIIDRRGVVRTARARVPIRPGFG